MSDNPETGFAAVVPPVEEPAPYVPAQSNDEAELQAANEPEPQEPQLSGLFRFEAGEIDDLVAFMKAWVEWRLRGGDTKDSGATKIGGGAVVF